MGKDLIREICLKLESTDDITCFRICCKKVKDILNHKLIEIHFRCKESNEKNLFNWDIDLYNTFKNRNKFFKIFITKELPKEQKTQVFYKWLLRNRSAYPNIVKYIPLKRLIHLLPDERIFNLNDFHWLCVKYKIYQKIPKKLFQSICRSTVEAFGAGLQWIPREYITSRMCDGSVLQYPKACKYISHDLWNKQIVKSLLLVCIHSNPFLIFYVPKRLWTEKIIWRLIRQDERMISAIPKEYFTLEMCKELRNRLINGLYKNNVWALFNRISNIEYYLKKV